MYLSTVIVVYFWASKIHFLCLWDHLYEAFVQFLVLLLLEDYRVPFIKTIKLDNLRPFHIRNKNLFV